MPRGVSQSPDATIASTLNAYIASSLSKSCESRP
jgi:hypothetical protein